MACPEGCQRWEGSAWGSEDVLSNGSPVTFSGQKHWAQRHFLSLPCGGYNQSLLHVKQVLSLSYTRCRRHYIFCQFTTIGRWQSWR